MKSTSRNGMRNPWGENQLPNRENTSLSFFSTTARPDSNGILSGSEIVNADAKIAGATQIFAQSRPTVSSHTSSPIFLLGIGIGFVFIGIILSFIQPGILGPLIGWFFSSIGALGMTMIYTVADARRQAASAFYIQQRFARTLYATTIIFSLVGILICAIQIALFVGRV